MSYAPADHEPHRGAPRLYSDRQNCTLTRRHTKFVSVQQRRDLVMRPITSLAHLGTTLQPSSGAIPILTKARIAARRSPTKLIVQTSRHADLSKS